MPTTRSVAIRALSPDEAGLYVPLRRDMLRDAPRAFCADPETDKGSDEASVAASLRGSGFALIGAWRADTLIGAAGLSRESRRKLHHRATLWGMWVRPEHRGGGVGEAIAREAVRVARGWEGLRAISLSACAAQTAAVRLYERVGFVAWGVEPAMIHVEGVYYDEVHMQLALAR
jgi:RimJ/RimL family protein N-acetyltransferase